MENANKFKNKILSGEICLGTCIGFSDATITEALCNVLDFVWIDMEHNPLSLQDVQGHIIVTKGTNMTPLVRVPWNDPVLIKPVLDIGAAGIVVPLARNAEDVRKAVSACLYPPEGIRGFGPKRSSQYGKLNGKEYCRLANETVMVIAQIEHIEAAKNLDEILAVPGLTSILIGPNDLSGSMGHMGEPRHPEVLAVIDRIIQTARKTDVFVGIAIGDDADQLNEWVDKGVQWLSMGNDCSLLLKAAQQTASQVRDHFTLNRQAKV